MESYFHESGQAGRDGSNAECTLFYSYEDVNRTDNLIGRDNPEASPQKKKRLDKKEIIQNYCENNTDCRRILQLDTFGEHFDRDFLLCLKNNYVLCDNCSKL